MIDVAAVQKLLKATTVVLSNGAKTNSFLEHLGVPKEFWDGVPSVGDWDGHKVDCHLLTVGVALDVAARLQADFELILEQLTKLPDVARVLADGPSFKFLDSYVGGSINSLRFLALGDAYGLWQVLTPADLTLPQRFAHEYATLGMVCMTGYPKSVFEEARQAVG